MEFSNRLEALVHYEASGVCVLPFFAVNGLPLRGAISHIKAWRATLPVLLAFAISQGMQVSVTPENESTTLSACFTLRPRLPQAGVDVGIGCRTNILMRTVG